MAVAIGAWQDLSAAEPEVLAAVRAHRFGAQLFLVDPVKFLRESGFSVGEPFATQLKALPGVRLNPASAYAEILAGRHPLCRQSIVISALGLPRHLSGRR
jgi:hypothetical protein